MTNTVLLLDFWGTVEWCIIHHSWNGTLPYSDDACRDEQIFAVLRGWA